MDREAEARALLVVQERLNQRFAHLGPEVVEAAVRLAYADVTGPVRDFVSILVERAARERLAHMVDYSVPPASRDRVSG
ncbi:three-helix bundle dimerization domain-containing protein [Pedococcus bigeumensis]|uniref:three-helix bundle dimerization domain-containing protein n=1 Tax=Pedococcus bigeumensis TaxID=433644 RepID=UPI002FEBF86B